jgi:serine/threonine-protein kinase
MSAVPAEPSSLGVYAPGQVLLGKYRLIEPLARGGMGAVWRARDELLSSDVAVKIADAGSVAVQRAHSEARLAAQLRHPAVCSTFDFGVSEQGDPLVVSELLKGDGLDEVLLVEGPLSPTRAVQLLLPILDALGAAHDAGIIHRDVKPSNLFLARDAAGNIQPKLLDFGIARGVSEATHLTLAGSICGTPDYMSPEQARGARDVDARSDVWSVCATLYELVSGRVPFPGDNYNAVIFAVGQRDPAPLRELRGADLPLAKIIERGLSKSRYDRFQTARELARALSQFLLVRGLETDVCGHSLRARISSADINLSAEPVLPMLALSSKREVSSRLAKTETRRSRHLLTEASPRARMAALSLIAAFMALAAWRAQGSPQPRAAEVSAGPSVIQLPDSQPTTPQLGSAPPVSPVSEASSPPPPPAATASTRRPSDSQRTANAKRAKGATRSNALGYDFGL